MPIDSGKLAIIKDRLAAYVKGWTAHALLKQSFTGEGMITGAEFKTVLTNVAAIKGRKPTIFDVIKGIIDSANAEESAIPWTAQGGKHHKDVVITCGGQVFKVKITKEAAAGAEAGAQTYSIDIQGEIDPKVGLNKFRPPGLVAGVTKIVFDNTGGYKIIPGHDISPIAHTAFPPRPLQLNVVRSFTSAITEDGAEPLQLGLLGTGTGKSFIIASVADAVGSSVTVVPDDGLAKQLLVEAMKLKILSDPMVTEKHNFEGHEVRIQRKSGADRTPYVVLAEDIHDVRVFAKLVARDDVHIILNANHEKFNDYLTQIKNKLLLIDESHQHAYTAEAASALEAICTENATLALTGTPTGHLLKVFKHVCVEFNLGKAIESHILRGVNGEDIRLDTKKRSLVDQAVISYFKPVYLQAGDMGYKPIGLVPNIDAVKSNLVPPCQKGMIFSDDVLVLNDIQLILLGIQNGTLPADKASFYKTEIRKSRIDELRKQLTEARVAFTDARLEAEVPDVNLHDELLTARKEAIKNTIHSFALSLLMSGFDREKFVHISRSGSLAGTDLAAANFRRLTGEADLDSRMIIVSNALKDLSEADKRFLHEEISAEVVALNIAMIAALGRTPVPSTLSGADVLSCMDARSSTLETRINAIPLIGDASSAIDLVTMDTPKVEADTKLAKLKFGFSSVGLSDQRWATGVSITDVLTSIIVNNYFDCEQHNAVSGSLGGAQAAGRVVRDSFLRGMATMITNDEVPEELILSIEKILALDSGEQSISALEAGIRARRTYDSFIKLLRSSPYASALPKGELKSLARLAAYAAASASSATLEADEALEEDKPDDIMPLVETLSGEAEAKTDEGIPAGVSVSKTQELKKGLGGIIKEATDTPPKPGTGGPGTTTSA